MTASCKNTHAYWKGLLEEHAQSGKSQNAFCKEKGVSASKMSYYRSALNKTHSEKKPIENIVTPINIHQAKSSEHSAVSAVKITLPNGFCCELTVDCSASYIKQLVSVLLSC